MKKCSKCSQTKASSEFSKDKQKSDGLCSYCKECRKPMCHKYFTENKDKYYASGKKTRLKNVYGLTLEQYEHMCINTPTCPICSKDITKSPHIDHDHTTGAVRSLLCGPCNRAIGLLGDSPLIALNASKYLERHKHA
jgi:hypothetical protein